MPTRSLQELLTTNFGLAPSGYTGSAGAQGTIGYTGSSGTPGEQGSIGPIGYTGSSGTGGGTAITVGTKTMEYTGTLVTFTGTKRWWINSNVSISRLLAYITTAPQGSNVRLVINKNASTITSVNIQANTNSTISSANIPVVQGDYITVDVAQVGSSTAGADLALIFEYS